MRRLFASAVLLVLAATPAARAQALSDTLFAWQGYGRESRCALAVYPVSEEARGRQDRYDRAVVLRERGDNAGPSTLADAPYLVEQAARTLGIDPVRIVWVFHWDGQSFGDAPTAGRKEVFLRATFSRTASGGLGNPSWRVVTRADVEELTDRRFGTARTAVASR